MEMLPLASSNLAAYGYDPQQQLLRIEFQNGGVAGTVDQFVAMMNRQAQAWGMKNTQFKNVGGHLPRHRHLDGRGGDGLEFDGLDGFSDVSHDGPPSGLSP